MWFHGGWLNDGYSEFCSSTNGEEPPALSHTNFNCISHHNIIIASVGLGEYWANVIQFGLDQLQDASTTGITAFISWFMWTYMSGGNALNFAYACISA